MGPGRREGGREWGGGCLCPVVLTLPAFSVVPGRQVKGLLTASFRFHLAMDTLAVQLYTSHYLGMFGTCTR